MKVSYVTPFYNSDVEGKYGRFHDFVHELRDMENPPFEFDVHAAIAEDPDDALASKPLHYIGSGEELYGTRRNNLEVLLNIRRMGRDIRSSNPDVVQVIDPNPFLLYLAKKAKHDASLVLGPNLAGWTPSRDSQGDQWHLSNSTIKLWMKFVFQKAVYRVTDPDSIMAFSEYHKEIVSDYDIDEDKITPVFLGVDAVFRPEGPLAEPVGSGYELLYVGNFTEWKGFDVLMEAVTRVSEDVSVRLVGSGEPDWALIDSLGIEDSVRFEGYVDREELPKYYRTADLCVIPSKDETAGTNIQFESLACGTPVVVTDLPGLNEYAERRVAKFFWPRTPEALSLKIDEAIDDLSSMCADALETSKRYNTVKTVSRLNEFYRELLPRGPE